MKTHDLMSIFLFLNRQVKCLADDEEKSKKYIGVFDLFTCKVVQTQFFSKKNRQNQPVLPQHNPMEYFFPTKMKAGVLCMTPMHKRSTRSFFDEVMDPNLAPHKHSFLSQNFNICSVLESYFPRRRWVPPAQKYFWMALFDV